MCMVFWCHQNTQLCVSGQQNHAVHKCVIKTHGSVSSAKKVVWHTNVFTGTTNLPFSSPCISITTALISIKFTYFMPSIYPTLHTKFEGNQPRSRHTVVCQQPRKPCGTQVFYLQELLTPCFQPLASL